MNLRKLIGLLLSVLLLLSVFTACGRTDGTEPASDVPATGEGASAADSDGTTQPAPPAGEPGQTPPTPPEGEPGQMPSGEPGQTPPTPPEGAPGQMPSGEPGQTPPTPPEGAPGQTPPTPPEGGPGGTPPDGGPGGTPPDGGPGGADLSYAGAVEITGADSRTDETYASDTADESALLIAASEAVTLTNPTVTKTGSSQSGDNCSFYGINAAVLVKDGAAVTVTGGTITSDGFGANGLFCYGGNGGRNGAAGDGTTLTVRDTVIRTTGGGSGGIMTTGGGVTYAYDLDVETSGQSSAPIRTDRGGGTVWVSGGSYVSNGLGSPAIYSTAEIHAANAALVSNLSEGVCIEGLNSVELTDCSLTANNTQRNSNASFLDSVMLYQSMSGDAASGTASFTMTGGSLTGKSGHVFHVTNTSAVINLRGVSVVNEDPENILLSVCADGWSGGANAATLNAAGQQLSGAVKVGSDSSLSLNLTEGSVFEGSIDGSIVNAKGETVSGEAGKVSVTLDGTSTWTLTADSWITEFHGDPARVTANGYTLYVNGEALTGTN